KERALLFVELLRSLVDHRASVPEVPCRSEGVGRIADLLQQLVRDVVARPLADEVPSLRLVQGDDALLAPDELREPAREPAVCLADVGHGLEGSGDLLETLELSVAPAGPEESSGRGQRGRQAPHAPPQSATSDSGRPRARPNARR